MKRALVLAVILCVPRHALSEEWPTEVLDAASAYTAGRFEEAAEKYGDAVLAGETRPEVVFNLGAARYRAADADSAALASALSEFRRAAASGADELRSSALYNGSNMQALLGDVAGAIEGYKEVLRQNPGDEDARYNLELLQRMQQQQEQQQEQGGEQDDQQKEQQENEQEQPEDPQQEQQDQPENEQQDPEEGQDDPESEQEQQGGEQPTQDTPPGEQPEPTPQEQSSITPEEALRQLDKLEEAERELIRQLLMQRQRRIDVEKDW